MLKIKIFVMKPATKGGTVKGVARKLCSRAMLDDAQGAACIAIEAGESPPVLADQYWVETPVTITRNRKLKLAGIG